MIEIEEVIVVEGRDDTAAIKRAVKAETIETHGFGIRKETWDLIDKAYETRGIIVFTDPDHAGEEIRNRILKRCPEAKEAFLTRDDATKAGDIGIENAAPEAIIRALSKVCTRRSSAEKIFSMDDIVALGLTGDGSRERRQLLGKKLGIGYGNAKSFLRKLNEYGISREQIIEEIADETLFSTDN